MTKVKLVPDSIIKKMDAKEFIDFAEKKPFLIRSSRFVPPQLGSGSMGWFIVEFENDPGSPSIRRAETCSR
jgi:hypothetical protein